jgi:hypothetical protein
MTTPPPSFEPLRILAVLEGHAVDYVLIGGFAATIHGSPLRTGDADVCPDRSASNLDRLAHALDELGARVRTPDDPNGLMFPHDATFIGRLDTWNLVTRFGWLDLSFQPSGTAGFGDLKRDAGMYDLGDGLMVRVASLADVIRSKEAAGREKDRAALPTLRRLLERSAES